MSLLPLTTASRGNARRASWLRVSGAALLCGAVACTSVGVASDEGASDDRGESGIPGTDDPISLGGDGDGDAPGILAESDPDYAIGGAGGAGSEPSCLRFMSWGSVALHGAVPGEGGMDAIVSWLNGTSTAEGQHYAEKPEITPEFLAHFDVILLQDLSRWEFSDHEIDLFEHWVLEGGGVMALSGYSTDPTQVTTTNRLLSFSGVSYSVTSDAGDTSTNLGECGYCLGVTHKQEGWNADHPIADGVKAVGAYQGRSIEGDGEIVAQENGRVLAMAKDVQYGRVFLFHDEWVSYNGQWSAGAPSECLQNAECAEVSPSTTYQIPRFWFNSFQWLAQGRECFVLDGLDPKR